jgi:hypothetical protein
MVRLKDERLWRLNVFPDRMKAARVRTFDGLVAKFIKKGRFRRFTSKKFSEGKLANFNIAVAETLLEEKVITKRERLKQNYLYSYRMKGWAYKMLKEKNLTHLDQIMKRCLTSKGAFKPLEDKASAVASNYELAKVLHKEKLLSTEEFLKVKRPRWKYRKLTKEEMGDIEDISVNISRWSKDTRIIIRVLWHWYYYKGGCRGTFREIKSVPLDFLVETFLRIPAWDDKPVFKGKGHRLSRVFGTIWTDKNLEDRLSIVEKTLRQHNFLV